MINSKKYYIYLLAGQRKGTLYIGITSDLIKRIYQHKNNQVDGFTKRYGVHSLVYFEEILEATEAIRREKQIKAWKRDWKIELIEKNNPNWEDLYETIL